jgi:hypothetical protein
MLRTINMQAAGIDIGSERLHVAVVGGPVQVFETFTAGLEQLGAMLCAAGVTTVAMEATGVYWLPVYEVFEAAGLEGCVVNGAHVKSLPGRKSDVADCQWLAELHSHGLLRPGRPPVLCGGVPPGPQQVSRAWWLLSAGAGHPWGPGCEHCRREETRGALLQHAALRSDLRRTRPPTLRGDLPPALLAASPAQRAPVRAHPGAHCERNLSSLVASSARNLPLGRIGDLEVRAEGREIPRGVYPEQHRRTDSARNDT